jgi:hypothetical protein
MLVVQIFKYKKILHCEPKKQALLGSTLYDMFKQNHKWQWDYLMMRNGIWMQNGFVQNSSLEMHLSL